MADETQGQDVTQSTNYAYHNATIIQLRLDTEKVLEKIEIFLKGSMIVYEQKNNQIIAVKKQTGTPKANQEGIQSIMNMLSCMINPQTVQGNFDHEEYDQYIEEINIALASAIVTNCYDWKIKDEDIEPIINFTMALVRPFMSRIIDNKERDGYSNTMRHVESNTTATKGFKIFGGK